MIPKTTWSSNDSLSYKPKLKTFAYLCLGLFIYGLGSSMLIRSNIGNAPWVVLAEGVSRKLNLSIGEATFPIILAFIITIVGGRFSWIFGIIVLFSILPLLTKLLNEDRLPKSVDTKINSQVGLFNKHWTRKEVLNYWLFWFVAVPLLVTPIFSTAFFE